MTRVRPHASAIIAGALFLALSLQVARDQTVGFDRRVQDIFLPGGRWSHSHQVASNIPDLVSTPRLILAFAVFAACLTVWRRSVRPLLTAVALVVTSVVAVEVTKHVTTRPDTGGHMGAGSFPSGHMATVVITAGGVLLVSMPRTRWWQWVAVSPVWVGMAGCLLYGDIHWVTDVIGGALLGWALLGVIGAFPDRTGLSGSRASEPVVGTVR
jgi:membrane-associated phospholipid phosphatase